MTPDITPMDLLTGAGCALAVALIIAVILHRLPGRTWAAAIIGLAVGATVALAPVNAHALTVTYTGGAYVAPNGWNGDPLAVQQVGWAGTLTLPDVADGTHQITTATAWAWDGPWLDASTATFNKLAGEPAAYTVAGGRVTSVSFDILATGFRLTFAGDSVNYINGPSYGCHACDAVQAQATASTWGATDPIAGVHLASGMDLGSVSAVPEPSGWVLLLAGVGVIGFVMIERERRRMAALNKDMEQALAELSSAAQMLLQEKAELQARGAPTPGTTPTRLDPKGIFNAFGEQAREQAIAQAESMRAKYRGEQAHEQAQAQGCQAFQSDIEERIDSLPEHLREPAVTRSERVRRSVRAGTPPPPDLPPTIGRATVNKGAGAPDGYRHD